MICLHKHTAISPEHNIVGVWVVSALEEVEEQVPRLNVYVSRVGSGCEWATRRLDDIGVGLRR